jgi:hypothetical protein
MPRPTTASEITRLEAELAEVRDLILKQQGLREVEEGGHGTRFRSAFTSAKDLRRIEHDLEARLNVLYGATL